MGAEGRERASEREKEAGRVKEEGEAGEGKAGAARGR